MSYLLLEARPEIDGMHWVGGGHHPLPSVVLGLVVEVVALCGEVSGGLVQGARVKNVSFK